MRDRVVKIAAPVVTAAAGIAGGVLLGRNARNQKPVEVETNRKLFGKVPLPKVNIDVNEVSKNIGEAGRNIGEAGKQFGKFASEVKTAREKAEQISKAISS